MDRNFIRKHITSAAILIFEFSDAHPDWSKSETLQDKYVTLAAKTNSDLGNKERKKVLDGLARETVLTKDVIDKIDS
jgi:hypothetical protein